MYKCIVFIQLSLLFICPAYGLISDINDLIKEIDAQNNYNDIIYIVEEAIEKSEIYLEDSLHRKLDDPYLQSLYEIETGNEQYYCINIIGNENTLVEISIYEQIHTDFRGYYKKKTRKEYYRKNKVPKKEFQTNIVNRLGNRPLNILVPNRTKEIVTVGFYCGRGGSKTPIVRKMLFLVKIKNRTLLNAWCKSAIPEIRMCGLFGLELLKAQGVRLSNRSVKLMEKVSIEKIQVETCSFCTYRGHYHTIAEEYSSFDFYISKLLE